ncbi:MAG: proline--tRNA ligase [Thermoleophilia bacterium]
MAKAPILASRTEDFPQWYQDVVAKAEMAENGAARGTMVIRPYGYGLWERMQAEMDARIKAADAENVYLPLFIPESYLRKEAEHVEGFSPELAVVTVAGGKTLEEPLVVRPTSETLFGELMAKWIQSFRDLPLLLNQWANVVRWELRPRIFLRTTEFLWQEGHTAHATQDDAAAYARRILLDVYRDFMTNLLAVPVLVGMKTARERFAGAINTMTCEAMMGDGRALQMGTSHELGQNFAKAFEMQYLDDTNTLQHCWTTSWGTTTRMIGGLIMCHGDDHGLRVPPRIAHVQAVVMVVRDDDAGTVEAEARRVAAELTAAGVRVKVDAQTSTGFGRRVTDWEIKGVPVRVELGPRDVGEGVVTLARRDDRTKETVPAAGLAERVTGLLETIQEGLLAEALATRQARTTDVATIDEAIEAAKTGFARIPWEAVGDDGEDRLAGEGITVRCLQREDGSVPDDPGEAGLRAFVARAY